MDILYTSVYRSIMLLICYFLVTWTFKCCWEKARENRENKEKYDKKSIMSGYIFSSNMYSTILYKLNWIKLRYYDTILSLDKILRCTVDLVILDDLHKVWIGIFNTLTISHKLLRFLINKQRSFQYQFFICSHKSFSCESLSST